MEAAKFGHENGSAHIKPALIGFGVQIEVIPKRRPAPADATNPLPCARRWCGCGRVRRPWLSEFSIASSRCRTIRARLFRFWAASRFQEFFAAVRSEPERGAG